MSIFFIVTTIIFYFLWDILTLDREIYQRVTNYKKNSKNIKVKPLCKFKTVLLFLITAILIAIITAISIRLVTLFFAVMWFFHYIVRKKKIRQILLLDEENKDYWKG